MRKGAHVLIVDDDDLMADVLGWVLKRAGCTWDFADSGDKGLSLASETRYDLIITDLNMPPPDGFELIRRVQASGFNTATPILVISGRADIDPDRFTHEYKVQGFLPKPFSHQDLLDQVAKALGDETEPH